MSHDLVNDKKWSRYKIDARNEKHDEISMTAYFKATDILVRDFTVILLPKHFIEIYMENSCWMESLAIQYTILLKFSTFQTTLKSHT